MIKPPLNKAVFLCLKVGESMKKGISVALSGLAGLTVGFIIGFGVVFPLLVS